MFCELCVYTGFVLIFEEGKVLGVSGILKMGNGRCPYLSYHSIFIIAVTFASFILSLNMLPSRMSGIVMP